MEEEVLNPMSADEKVPFRDLAGKEKSRDEREEIEVKKHSMRYYFILGTVMIVLVLMGIFLGVFIKNRQVQPSAEPVEPTPIIERPKEASPASTIEVIRNKITELDGKLETIDLDQDQLLPPAIDYDLEAQLEEIDID